MQKAQPITSRIIVTLLLAITLGFSSFAFAHKGASGVVKKRMDAMKEMKVQLKQVSDILKGKKPYSVKNIRKSLDYIGAHGGGKMTRLFPKGSDHKPSEADPLIWKKWPEFKKMALQLTRANDEMRALLAKTKADKETLKPLHDAYLSLNRTCKTCHDRFRE